MAVDRFTRSMIRQDGSEVGKVGLPLGSGRKGELFQRHGHCLTTGQGGYF